MDDRSVISSKNKQRIKGLAAIMYFLCVFFYLPFEDKIASTVQSNVTEDRNS